MKIVITEEQKKKIFIPRKLSKGNSRYDEWNNSQPIKDGVRINQFDEEGRKQGYWEVYHDNGRLYKKGSYKDGEKDGRWKWYYENGKLEYMNEYKNGVEEGYSESYWDNGELANKGNFVNNEREGYWEWYSNKGILYSKGFYKNGRRLKNLTESEKKKLFIPRKLSKSDHRWMDHNKSQPIKNINGENIRINQYDYEGIKQGYWEEYYSNGEIMYKGNYKDDKQDGYWEYYHSNGRISSKGSYKNGKADGYWESYWNNGQLMYKVYYKDDKVDGYWEKYFITGQLDSKGSYVDGKEEGYLWRYDVNGELWFKGYYKSGELINTLNESEKKKLFIPRKLSKDDSRFDEWNNSQPIVNGVRINQYDYEGRKQGYWEEYWDNGVLYSKGSYKDNKEEGYWEGFRETGELWFTGTFKNGNHFGEWVWYWENGELFSKGSYDEYGEKEGIWEYYYFTGEHHRTENWDDYNYSENITESEKKKLFIPRKLSKGDSRFDEWNNKQPIKNINGEDIRINQFDEDGNKQGYWEIKSDSGRISKGNFVNNEREGYWESYFHNGVLYFKGVYVDGFREGYWETYYMNGQINRKGNYDFGARVGYWESYFDDGSVNYTGTYINGTLIKDNQTSSNNNPINEGRVKEDERIKIYEDDKILVVSPLTHKASCKYGSNTPWCVAVPSNDEHFNEYSDNGILIYFIIKSPYEYGDIKEYKFAYYQSINKEMDEYDGWYDMSDYQYIDGKKEENPDLRLIKFLIPKKVMSLVFTFIKEQKPIFNKKIKEKKEKIFNMIINDPLNTKIVDDKNWVILYRNEPFGKEYEKINWFPNPIPNNELFVIYGDKKTFELYRQKIQYYYDIRTVKHSNYRPDVYDLNGNNNFKSFIEPVFLKYFKQIALAYFKNRKENYEPNNYTQLFLWPEYAQVGDILDMSSRGVNPKIINIKKLTNNYIPYDIDVKYENGEIQKNIYINDSLGIGVIYDKEKHNPTKI